MSAFRLRSTGLLAFALFLTAGPDCGQTARGQSVQTTAGHTSLSDGGLIVDPGYGQGGYVQGTSAIGTRGGYLWVEGVFGERPGSQGNYFNVGSFLPGPEYRGGMTYADVQIFGDENALVGIDANLGWRTITSGGTLLGLYGFYTHDHSANEYAYDWAGGGLQAGRGHLQLDSNFYIPLGYQDHNVGARIPTANITVRERTIGFIDQQLVEQAMRGFDVNVTGWVPGYEWLYGGIGGYHFNARDGENTSGVRFRGGLDFNDVQVGLNVTNDTLYGTSTDVNLTYLMGRGGFAAGLGGGETAVDRRLYDRVVKQRRVATTTFLKDVFTPAGDGRGGTLDIAYVRNTNIDPGDGTFENPFNRLDRANGVDVDIIAVLRGSTSPATKLQAGDGLFLTNHQRLLGEGLEHFIDIPGRGTFLVPNVDTMGSNPYVTANPGASIVNLRSNNEVNGLNLMPAAGGFGIRGTSLNNFVIRNINRDVPMGMPTGPGSGILVRNVTGSGLIENVAFNISDPSAYGGIRVENTNMSLFNLMVNNVPQLVGGQVGVGVSAINSEINAQITNVNASQNGTGLQVVSNGTGEVNIAVGNSSFDDAALAPGAGVGIAVISDDGLVNMSLVNTTATGAGADGLNIDLRNDALLNLGGTDVDVSDAGRDAIHLFANDADANINFLRVMGDDAGRDGINIFANNTAGIDFIVTDGSLTGAGRDATHVEVMNLSNVNLVVDPTPSTGAGRHGLFFNVQSDSQLDVLFEDSNLSTAMDPTGSHGVFGTIGGNSLVNLVLDNSHVANAGGNGLLVNVATGSEFDGLILNSAFVGAGANAFELNLNNSIGSLVIDGASAGGATGSALVVNANNGSQFAGLSLDTNFSAAGGDGVRLNFNDSNGTLVLNNTPVVNVGDNAFDLRFVNNSTLNVGVTNSPSFGASQNVVMFDGDTGSILNASFVDSNLSTNANPSSRGGIFGTLDNGAVANLTLLRSDVSMPGMNALDDGLMVSADNGSTLNASITDSSFTDVVGSAFVVFLDNGSTGTLNLNNAPGSRAGVDGLFARATNGSTFSSMLTNGTVFDDVGATPLRLISDSGSTVTVTGVGVSGANAGSHAISVGADGGTVDLALMGPASFDDAGGNGLSATLAGGGSFIGLLDGVTFNNAGLDGINITGNTSTFDVQLLNSGVMNAGFDAFDLNLNNTQGTLVVSNTDATTAGDNAVEIDAVDGSMLNLQLLNGITLDGAGNDIFSIDANNSIVNVNAPGISGSGAGGDVVDFTAANGSMVQIDLVGMMGMPTTFDGAAGDGVMGVLTGGSTATVNLTDASFTGLGGDTFSITATDSTFTGNILRTDFTAANGNAVALAFVNSTGDVNITNSQLDMAGNDGVNVAAANMSMLDIDIIDSSVTGAGDDAYDINFSGGSIVDLFVDPTPSTGAADHGLEFFGTTGGMLTAAFEDSDLSTMADPTGGTAVEGSLVTGAGAMVRLTNSDIASAGGNAMNVTADGGSTFGAVLTDVDASNAAMGGIRILADTNSTASLSATNVDVTNANNAGLNLVSLRDSAVTANINNVQLDDAGEAAMQLFANFDATIGVMGNGVSGANAGLSAIDITSLGGSAVDLNVINAGSFAMAGNSGLTINANDARAVANLAGTMGTPVSFDGAGDEGIDIDATNGAFAQVMLSDVTMQNVFNDAIDVDATNSTANVVINRGNLNGAGASAAAGTHGVELTYNNSTGTVNLTDTSVDGALEDAFHIETTAPTTLNMKLTTVTAVGAGDDTFDLTGVGPATLNLAIDPNDLTGAGDNTFEFDFSQGATLNVLVQDSPMSTAMTPVGNNVIQGVLNSGGSATFDVQNSQMTNATNDAVNIVADGMGSSFVGIFDANSDMNDAGDNALDLTATNGAMIGIMSDGVSFDNAGGSAIIGNFDGNATGLFDISNFSADMSGNIGLELTADNDSMIGGSFTNGSFDMNANHGIKLTTNPDMSLNDNSLIDLDFDGVTADGNFGDGMNAMAFNGNDTAGMPQMTGIIVDFANGSLSNNSNMNLGDGIGYGVSGMADGDGSGAQNTRITFNFVNTDLVNNEEGAFNRETMDGGAVDFSFMGGMIGGQDGLDLCADGPLDVFNFTLNGTMIGNNPAGPGLLAKAINDGTLNASISNVDFSNNGEQGVRFIANTGGTLGLRLENVDIMSNGQMASADGIYGTVGVMNQAESLLTPGKFATAEFDFINVNVGDNPESALDVDVATGGIVSGGSTVVGGTFTGNSTGGMFDEVEYSVDGAGSILATTFSGLNVDGAVANAFSFVADDAGGPATGGNLAIGLNNISAENAGIDALSVLVDNATATMSVNGFDGSGAAVQGADFDVINTAAVRVNNFNDVMLDMATGGDALEVTVINSQLDVFNSNNLTVLNSNDTGIDIDVDNGVGNFDFDGVMADGNNVHGLFAVFNNGSTGTLNANNITATNTPNGAPFVARSLNGSDIDVMVTNGNFFGSSVFVNNVEVQALNGSTADAIFDNVIANGPTINGFFFDYQTGSMGDVSLTNSMAMGATNTGVVLNVLGGSDVDATLDNVTADTAGQDGVAMTVANSTADATLNNVTATNVMNDGVRITANGSTVNAMLTGITADGAGADGVELTGLNSTLTAGLDMIRTSNTGSDGLVLSANNTTLVADVNDVIADMADDNGVVVSVTNGSTANVNSFNNVTATNAGTNGVGIDVLNSTLATFEGMNITADNNGRLGIGSGFDVFVDGAGAMADLNLMALSADSNSQNGLSFVANDDSILNFGVDGFSADMNLADGVVVSAGQTTAGSMVDATLANGSASQNGTAGVGSGLLGLSTGGGTELQVVVDSVLLEINQNNGAEFGVDFGATLDATLNNGVSASGNLNGDGVLFNADGAGTMASLTSTAGTNQFSGNAGDGVDFNLTGTATATDITVVGDADLNTGDGVNVTTDGSGVTINNLALTNGALTANNNIGTGIVVDLDNVLGMTTIDISNFSVTGNQGVGNPRGVAGVDVSLANMTLDSVNMMNLDASGNPGGTGIGLSIDNTTVTNDVLLTGFTADGNGGTGVDVEMINSSSVDTLQVSGSASGNTAGDGVSVVANDGTAQTIGSLLIGGMGLTIDNNAGTGLIVDLDNINGLTMLDISGLSATGNGGAGNPRGVAGIDVAIANTTLDTLNMSDLDASGNPGGTGIGLLLDGTTVTTAVDVSNFVADGNGGGGTSVTVQNGSNIQSLTVNGSASGNLGGDGLSIVGSNSMINNFSLTGAALNLNGNSGNGLTVDFDAITGLSDFDLSQLTVTGNLQDQINVSLANMILDTVTMSDVTATGLGAGVGMGDGIEFTFDNTIVDQVFRLERVSATDNGEDGLQLTYLNASSTPVENVAMTIRSGIDVGTFDDNGLSGIHVNLSGASSAGLDITNSTGLTLGTTSSSSNNGLHGLNIELQGASKLTMGSVDSQAFDNNAGSGVMISSVNSDFLSGSSFTNNTMSDNGSFGFFGRFFGGFFDIALGDTATSSMGNVIDNNVGAGIAIEMIQDATGRLAFSDNQITNTSDDNNAGTIYQGDAIVVSQLGTSDPTQATNLLFDVSAMGGPGLLIQGNRIGVDGMGNAMGNDGHGITFQLEEQSSIQGLQVFDNMVMNSGIDGLNFRRFDQVNISGFEIGTIGRGNMFINNADDGIEITGENDNNSVMMASIDSNDIMMNGNDGIALQVNADANLAIDILRNNIIQNAQDGIQTGEITLDPSDARMISGDWSENIIANNGRYGIISNAVLGTVTATNNTIGAVLDSFGQVMIDGNGSTGVELNNAGTTIWTTNQVIRNGRSVTANRALGHGFDIQGAAQNVTFDNNLIRENFQDGIEFNNNSTGRNTMNISLTQNRVQDNRGRGFDILNQQNAQSNISITNNNVFSSNDEEGIYAVNTASGNQNQTNFASATLNTDGNTTRDGRLGLIVDSAQVFNNGDSAIVGNLVNATGLLVRVGSNDDPNVHDGFTGNSPSNTLVHMATDGSGTPNFINGGVFVQLTSSQFGGNFGDDVFFHGFVSTGDPGAVGGTWNDMEYSPGNTNNGDPLARLDVLFGVGAQANVFDATDFTNGQRQGTPNGQAGAFYESTDAMFKSRDNMQTPPGPFPTNATDRRRNAQRTPIRAFADNSVLNPDNDGTLPFAGTPDNGRFQYPGMGDSTFRVRATSGNPLDLTADFDGDGSRDFGIFDDDALFGGDFGRIESNGEQNGVGFTGGVVSGELPFGWATY